MLSCFRLTHNEIEVKSAFDTIEYKTTANSIFSHIYLSI